MERRIIASEIQTARLNAIAELKKNGHVTLPVIGKVWRLTDAKRMRFGQLAGKLGINARVWIAAYVAFDASGKVPTLYATTPESWLIDRGSHNPTWLDFEWVRGIEDRSRWVMPDSVPVAAENFVFARTQEDRAPHEAAALPWLIQLYKGLAHAGAVNADRIGSQLSRRLAAIQPDNTICETPEILALINDLAELRAQYNERARRLEAKIQAAKGLPEISIRNLDRVIDEHVRALALLGPNELLRQQATSRALDALTE